MSDITCFTEIDFFFDVHAYSLQRSESEKLGPKARTNVPGKIRLYLRKFPEVRSLWLVSYVISEHFAVYYHFCLLPLPAVKQLAEEWISRYCRSPRSLSEIGMCGGTPPNGRQASGGVQ